MREGAGPAVPVHLALTWPRVYGCVLGKVSPPRSLLGGERAHIRTRNKMTHCRGHSRTAPPGTCRSRDRGRERHQSRQPRHTGCGCYTCGGKRGSWEKDRLRKGGGSCIRRVMDTPKLGRSHGNQGHGAFVGIVLFPACSLSSTRQAGFLYSQSQHTSSSGPGPGHHFINCFPRHPSSLPS